jgi:hypothetical protein
VLELCKWLISLTTWISESEENVEEMKTLEWNDLHYDGLCKKSAE